MFDQNRRISGNLIGWARVILLRVIIRYYSLLRHAEKIKC